MLKNYFKVVIRSMNRNKVYAVINILGLAVGMAASILILLFVKDELSYDRYHDKHERIFRVSREWLNEDGETGLHLGHVAPPFGPLLRNDFEGVVLEAVRFQSGYQPLMSRGERKFEESSFFFVEENVFDVFSWELLQGDPATALADPFGIVITQSMALKYFGSEDPMEQELVFNNFGVTQPLKVTGVMEDIPRNSHFQLDMMASFKLIENFYGVDQLMQNFGSNNYATYLLLPEGYDIKDLEAQIPEFMDRHLGDMDDGRPMSDVNKLHFWPLASIHLHSHLDSEVEPNGDIAFVYLFIIIAFFTVLIACINFMNLSTAKSATRSKEVGLRKVLGAVKGALVRQFITESILYSFFGLLIAILLVNLSLPSFNDFIQKDISFNMVENSAVLWILVGVMIFVGIVSGSYPAFFLSSFQPAAIIRKSFQSGRSKINLRSTLVVFQFTLSIGLIIGVGIVQDQIEFMKNKPLGFDEENIMILPMSQQIYDEYENVRGRLLQQPGIRKVALGSRIPSDRLLDSQGFAVEINGEMQNINFRVADVHTDHDYIDLFDMEIIAGRDFNSELATDSSGAFIINESAVFQIGWNSVEEAIGSNASYGGERGTIIGVVKNFHFESLHQSIVPIIFKITSGRFSSLVVKYDPEYKGQVEGYLKEQWSEYRSGFPFDYTEVKQQFSDQYNQEVRVAKLGTTFSWLAVFIAALGLYGLASFVTEQRIKEIGIRKVLGASVNTIVVLLTRNFTYLVLISLVLAVPLMYWLMTLWLNQFAYHDPIHISPFLYAGAFAILVAWLTVGYQTVKAALSNPVDSLKDE